MSEILITGMEMLPEGFAYDVRIKGNGDVVDRQTGVVMGKAIELPTHGRLGDLDKVAGRMHNNSKSCRENGNIENAEIWERAEQEVRLQGTVIEASKEKG